MYNPYLSLSEDTAPIPPDSQASPSPPTKEGNLTQLLKLFKLDDLDTGDILLLLILFLLFLDNCEDNLELIVALGLILIL